MTGHMNHLEQAQEIAFLIDKQTNAHTKMFGCSEMLADNWPKQTYLALDSLGFIPGLLLKTFHNGTDHICN